MKLLLSAWACLPNRSTEPGNGWGWATELARLGIEVHVLTSAENRGLIEEYLQSNPIGGMYFWYIDSPLRWLTGVRFGYILWQWSALKKARALHRVTKFDIAHHVTLGSVHVPSQLWRLGIPVVFGPVGGGQTAPHSMLSYFGRSEAAERRRTLLTRMLRHSPLHRAWLGRMTSVFVTNRDTLELVESLGRRDAKLMFDTALPASFRAAEPRRFSDRPVPLRLLWVGTIVPRKAISLTLDILAKANCPVTLTIIGDGIEPSLMSRLIADRGLSDRVLWSGRRLPFAEVRAAYLDHDALLFTSLRDSCAAQLLEAMAMGLPIITLDLHGAVDLVPVDAEYKIPVIDPEQVIRDAAAALDRFASLSGEERSRMSVAGWSFAQGMTYSNRAKQMETIYESVVASRQPAPSMLHASTRTRYGTGE